MCGNCYRFFNIEVTFADALTQCAAMDAKLTTVMDKEVHDFFDKVLEQDYNLHWIFGQKDRKFLSFTFQSTLMSHLSERECKCKCK